MMPSHHRSRKRTGRIVQTLSSLGLVLIMLPVRAGEVTATLVDQNGDPVNDAVMYLQSVNGVTPDYESGTAVVDQVDKAFTPFVQVVTVNSAVDFPNSDDIRHHVYSFSEAKTFELPLYIGTPANPVLFDQTGVVDLGCNIHDFMRGYVLVLETPYFAKSESGRVRLADLPAGQLALRIWHPQLAEDGPISESVELASDDAHHLSLTLELRGELNSRRAPKRRGRRY